MPNTHAWSGTRSRPALVALLASLAAVGAWAVHRAAPTASAEPPAGAGAAAAQDRERDGDGERVITVDTAPAAVRAAAMKLAGGAANITKVIREEDEDDVVTYEVEYTDGGVPCSANFSPAGDLMEQERATTEAKLPPAAVAALRHEFPNAAIADAQVVTRTFYEVQVVIDGKKREVRVDAAGAIEEGHAAHAGAENDERDGNDNNGHDEDND